MRASLLPDFTPDEMLRFAKHFLPESPIILDSGGYLCNDTKIMRDLWPDETMHVFEAFPTLFEKMVKNTKHLSGVAHYP